MIFLPAAGELEEGGEVFWGALVAVAFGDGEEEAEAFRGGIKSDGVGVVGVDPAVFGEVDDLFGESGGEGACIGARGGEEEFGLGIADEAGGGGPGGGFLGAGGAFFFEEWVPFGIGGWGFSGDGEGEGEVFETGVAGLGAAHPDGAAGKGDGGAGVEFFGRGDLGLEEDVALVALGLEGEHHDAFGFGVFEVAPFPAAGEIPFDASGDADDAGLFPVGVEAGFVMDEDADVEGCAGLDVGDFGDEIDGEADSIFLGPGVKGEKKGD